MAFCTSCSSLLKLVPSATSLRCKVLELVSKRLARVFKSPLPLGILRLSSRRSFAESSSLLRAFKRWTGMTFKQYQTKLLTEPNLSHQQNIS